MIDVAQPIPKDVTKTDYHAKSADGSSILVRWYTKDGAEPGPAVVFLHGSGMILSSLELYDGTVSRYVSASGVSFLSVDYRLAPEYPHPKPLEDAYAGLTWLVDHADELGVDTNRIAVMGDSGGGGVAAGLALLARDRGGPAIAKQILIYPMLDDRTTTPDPVLEGLTTWSYDDNITAWQALLGDAFGSSDLSPYAAPARMNDATGMPPLYMEALELDIFRNENIEYASRTMAAGISTELRLHPSVPHGFETVAFDSAVAKRIRADRIRVLKTL
ncbi:alpha/beta hydrolase [Kibdelosporangium philippinense]|uniref:Alpha/beta hydrolase n=2 Tax=Kibdelosporangium philippinense TaxID=211113 RepID=A0ABS8ZR50_9PSEU|nr:alpha/beta hydrolase [Kibdelosporangium philippinense]MCE7010206.1 alpha/beta hydrolase [Kibdelosporangium philippinense]